MPLVRSQGVGVVGVFPHLGSAEGRGLVPSSCVLGGSLEAQTQHTYWPSGSFIGVSMCV